MRMRIKSIAGPSPIINFFERGFCTLVLFISNLAINAHNFVPITVHIKTAQRANNALRSSSILELN